MPSPPGGENAGMDEQVLQFAEQLLETGFLKLSERERRVITGVVKRTQISRDVNRTFAEKQTLGDRLADRVASFGGSWTFSPVSCRADRLDRFQQRRPSMAGRTIRSLPLYLPQPLSFHAGRAAGSDHLDVPEPPGSARPSSRRLDYEVNLKAEIEIIELHVKLDRILGEHLEELLRTQREQLQLLTQLAPANSNAQ